jgi:hypothetical protein
MSKVEVFVPVAHPRVDERPLAARRDALKGLRIGWLDNMKANAAQLLADARAVLAARGHHFKSVLEAKNPTAAAPATVMAHLLTCDAVVLAIAD